jgi:hypothetical protein
MASPGCTGDGCADGGDAGGVAGGVWVCASDGCAASTLALTAATPVTAPTITSRNTRFMRASICSALPCAGV